MAAGERPEAAGGSAGADREPCSDKKVKFPKFNRLSFKRTRWTHQTDVLVKRLGAGCSHSSQMQVDLQHSGDLNEQKGQKQRAGGLLIDPDALIAI